MTTPITDDKAIPLTEQTPLVPATYRVNLNSPWQSTQKKYQQNLAIYKIGFAILGALAAVWPIALPPLRGLIKKDLTLGITAIGLLTILSIATVFGMAITTKMALAIRLNKEQDLQWLCKKITQMTVSDFKYFNSERGRATLKICQDYEIIENKTYNQFLQLLTEYSNFIKSIEKLEDEENNNYTAYVERLNHLKKDLVQNLPFRLN